MLEDLHTRLSGVVVECLYWSPFIARYDSADTLFYLDPPYWGREGDYGRHLFRRSDFTAMAEQLGKIRGRFMLSLNDVPEVRAIFGAFQIADVSTAYTIQAGGAASRNELLMSNYRQESRLNSHSDDCASTKSNTGAGPPPTY